MIRVCNIIGHRGCSYAGYNQNTIRAFEKVLSEGARAIEFDVQKTSDDELVIVHNLDLGEVSNGTGPVNQTPYSEIAKLYAGKQPELEDPIPKLQDVFELITSYQKKIIKPVLHVELKGKKTGILAGKLIRKYLDSGKLTKENFLLSSFHWDELYKIKEVCPELSLALLSGAIKRQTLQTKISSGSKFFPEIFSYPYEDFMIPLEQTVDKNIANICRVYTDKNDQEILIEYITKALSGAFYDDTLWQTAKELEVEAVNLCHLSISRELVATAHNKGFKVNLYTLNKREEIEYWVKNEIDGFFTDYYSMAHNILTNLNCKK